MSDNFDPYHKWLGIAPSEQPPNHYRLLGLNLFESDLDVIESGSDRQMAHLRSFQTGPRMRDCQRLLNEVSSVRVVLLDAQKKSAYDQVLRASLARVQAPPQVEAVPLTPADMLLPVATALAVPTVPLSGASSAAATSPVVVAKKTSHRRKPMIGVGTIVVGGAIGLVALFACGYGLRLMLRPSPRPLESTASGPTPKAESVEPAETRAEAPPIAPEVSGSDAPIPSRPVDSAVAAAPAAMPTPEVVASEPSIANPDTPGSLGDLVNASVDAKLAAPADAELNAARQQMQRLFANELTKERSPQESATLADDLQKQAIQSGTQPAMRYAMLEAAIDVAAKGGAVDSAARAIQELDRAFLVDLAPLKADAAQKISRVAKEVWEHKAVAELLEEVIDECLAGDRYELAVLLANAATDAARKSKDSSTISRVAARSRDVKSLIAKFAPVRAALELLASSSDDPAPNEIVGQHLCLVRGRWDKGLPYLAKSGAGGLRDVAERDMRNPTDSEMQAAIAAEWLKAATQLEQRLQLNAYRRAEYWYRQAVSQASGLKKLPLEQQINDVGKEIGKLAELPSGAVLVMTFEPSTLKRQGYVLDVSQHGYVGVVRGAVMADGIAGKALAFDGKDAYVEIASTPWLSAPSAFTLAAWVNVVAWNDPSNAIDYVLSKEDGKSSRAHGYLLRYRKGGFLNFTLAASGWQDVISVKKASIGEWHHAAATYDGKICRVFMDGEQDGNELDLGAIDPSDVPFRIGQAAYFKERGIRGFIDEVAIFNRGLSAEEVRTVYRIGRAGRPLME